jgi:hypothetical protein
MDLPTQCDMCGTPLAKELAEVDQRGLEIEWLQDILGRRSRRSSG